MANEETLHSIGIDGSMACIGIAGISNTGKLFLKGNIKGSNKLSGMNRMQVIFRNFYAEMEDFMTPQYWASLESVSVESPVVGRKNPQTAIKLATITGMLAGYFVFKKPTIKVYNPNFAEIKTFYGFPSISNRVVGKRDVGNCMGNYYNLQLEWNEKEEGFNAIDDPDINADTMDAIAHATFAYFKDQGINYFRDVHNH